ncbi:ThuA domain-containing protein [Haloferula sp. A504]|uniref:ThuA domain-containing protein n=1 Tax=Haloferula sp. A504 TaxID=3373601 RepID=UPI0031BCFEBE|nr:ThuA domain-containing protein [Verrucomicrobiaceae bacterium E54]
MKTTLLLPLGLAIAAGLIAASPKKEMPPAGALEKIVESLPAKPYAKPKQKRKLLVFSKTAGFRHKSIATGKVALEEMGEKTGAFEAVISDDLANFEPDKIGRFDAILFLSTTQNVFKGAENEKALQESLMSFIRSGKGFIGIHAATDTFYNWPEYGEMINGYFDGHPWGAGTPVHIFVEPGKEEHPLAAMFEGEPLEFKEEIYQLKDPYDSSKVDMLLRLDREKSAEVKGIKRKDNDFGVAWARNWGEGRVFYCSLGHNHHIYWHPKVLRHYLAGIQWALGDYEVEVAK